MTPTLRSALLIGLAGLSALVLPPGVVYVALGVIIVLVGLDGWWARRAPFVERSLPATASRGVPTPVRIAVSAGARRVRVRQPTVPDLRLEPSEDEGGLDAVLRPRRRGRHEIGPVSLRVTGPLGLARRDFTWGEPVEVRVYPDLPQARRLAQQVRTGRFRDPGQRPRGPLGIGTEFETVRDYLPDDDIRQINWRATERLQRPMSNQYREENERDVLCVVDAGRLMAAPLGDLTRLDAALDAVAAVAAVADALGDRCGCVAFDAVVRRRVPTRRSGGRVVVDALYDLEPVLVDSDYELAFAIASGGKRALVLVLTDLLDLAAARSLVSAMPTLVARHAVVVASAVDPDVTSLARTAPTDAVGAYAMATAVGVLEDRARVVAELQRAGARVVEAPRTELGASCVGAYLRLKSQARL